MKRTNVLSGILICLYLIPFNAIGQGSINNADITLQIDGLNKLHQLDGIGVNANTRSWEGNELEPGLNLLLDSMHATIWRVVVETVEKWEEVNDNNDPFSFNWDYYNKLYETPKFQKVWEMIRYLNQHGVNDKLSVCFMGFAPPWMGIKVIDPENEDEFVEMIVSFFYYAIKVKNLKFGIVEPFNETDNRKYSEGPYLTGKQHTRILRKFIDRMEILDIMAGIRIVGPNDANIESSVNEFMPAIMEDSTVMARLAHFGLHSYRGYYYPQLKDFFRKSAYPNSGFWITEWNAWCKGCDEGKLGEYNYDFAARCVDFLLELLQNGASAAVAWEGYDSYYEHHAPSPFSYWGLLGYEPKTKTYFPRKNFYAIQHVSKFVSPGSWLVSVSAPRDSLTICAFYDSLSQRVSIVGINKKHSPVVLNGTLANLPAIKNLEMYYTNNTENLHEGAGVTVKNKAFKASIPAGCIFTLTGSMLKNKDTIPISNHPVLVLAGDRNFGFFTGEILKTEGFNEYQMDSVSNPNVSPDYLRKFDIIILTECILTEKQQKMFAGFVKEGGCLIAFRPDRKLCDVFGLSYAGGTFDDAYISVDTGTEIGRGITASSMQFHGTADKYILKSGIVVAGFCKNALALTGYPGIVYNDYGKGHAMAFLYNLPQSIVLTRQGNPRDAGLEKDGILGLRAMDMFTDGWLDTSKNILNQADEQMRLLSHGIEKMNSYTKPLPRIWYFPDTLKCLVTLHNDGEDSNEAGFQRQFADVDSRGAKMTLYVKEVDLISKTWINAWTDKGFEISGHPDDTKQAADPDWKTMDSVYKNLIFKLKNTNEILAMHTVTNHWIVWCGKNADGTKDFAAQARIEENNGIRLDCNYLHYDNISNKGHFLGALGTNQGNFTGSGLVMKFSDVRGNVINVYQHLNNVYDQQYFENKDQDGYYNCFKGLADRSLNDGVFTFVSIKSHNDEYHFSKVPLLKMLDYANSKGIPVWTEMKLLNFLEAKDEASFTDIKWKNNKLTFNIISSISHSNGISIMVPNIYDGKKIRWITSNGKVQSYSVKSIKGFEYAMVIIRPGFNYSISASY